MVPSGYTKRVREFDATYYGGRVINQIVTVFGSNDNSANRYFSRDLFKVVRLNIWQSKISALSRPNQKTLLIFPKIKMFVEGFASFQMYFESGHNSRSGANIFYHWRHIDVANFFFFSEAHSRFAAAKVCTRHSYIYPRLLGVLSNGDLSAYSSIGFDCFGNGVARCLQRPFDPVKAKERRRDGNQASKSRYQSPPRGPLLCGQVLFGVCCLFAGFYIANDTFKNSSRIGPNAGAFRLLLCAFGMGVGVVLATLGLFPI